mgnify:CR=1 FL=1
MHSPQAYAQIARQVSSCQNLLVAWMNSDRKRLQPYFSRSYGYSSGVRLNGLSADDGCDRPVIIPKIRTVVPSASMKRDYSTRPAMVGT